MQGGHSQVTAVHSNINQQTAAANFARQLLQNPGVGNPNSDTVGSSDIPDGIHHANNINMNGGPSSAGIDVNINSNIADNLGSYGSNNNSNSNGGIVVESKGEHNINNMAARGVRAGAGRSQEQKRLAIGGDPSRVIRNASDASFNERKIFIGGLSYDTSNEMLKEFFEQKYGTVDSAEIMRDRATNISRGFGFVIFADYENVDRAVMDSPFECYGTKVDIRRAQPKSERMAEATPFVPPPGQKDALIGKVFVGGLDFDIKETQIRDYFSKFGPVKHIEMMNRATGQPRGFCFLTFQDPEHAQPATGRHPELSRSCEVKLAVPRPYKGQHPIMEGVPTGGGGPYSGHNKSGGRPMISPNPGMISGYSYNRNVNNMGDMPYVHAPANGGAGGPIRGYPILMPTGGQMIPPDVVKVPYNPMGVTPEIIHSVKKTSVAPNILKKKFSMGKVYSTPSNSKPTILSIYGSFRSDDKSRMREEYLRKYDHYY